MLFVLAFPLGERHVGLAADDGGRIGRALRIWRDEDGWAWPPGGGGIGFLAERVGATGQRKAPTSQLTAPKAGIVLGAGRAGWLPGAVAAPGPAPAEQVTD